MFVMTAFLAFQSPRSGKFVSDKLGEMCAQFLLDGFNPLDRGNLYQILTRRGEKNLIFEFSFQSPRSGKFVSDSEHSTDRKVKKAIRVSIP